MVQAIKDDYRSAGLDGPTQALLEYAEKVTRNPARMTKDDVESLRREGFSDEAILDATCVAAFFNYINRMSDGLGIEMEELFKER